jgi:hypothetical protein
MRVTLGLQGTSFNLDLNPNRREFRLTGFRERLGFAAFDQTDDQPRRWTASLMHRVLSVVDVSAINFRPIAVFPPAASQSFRGCSLRAYVIALMMAVCSGGWAQDSLRVSLAGQVAMEAKKQALENQRYNVKLGPVSLRLGAQLGLAATDNVRYTGDQNAEADVIIRPQLNLASQWRVTEKNSLNLSLGVGYDKYVSTSDYDSLYLAPDSDLSFDMYIADFVVNLHSRFSYSQEVTGDPTISGIGRLSRFENTSGVRAMWDLNTVVLAAGYDHEVYMPTEQQYSQYSRSSELGTVSAAVRIRPTISAGLEVGAGLTTYDDRDQTRNNHFSIGPMFSVQLSEYTSVRLAGGYVSYLLDASATTNATTQVNAFYCDLTLRQRLGNAMAHSLSIGRQLQSGFFSTTTDQYYARYGANWRLFRKTSLNLTLSYQNIEEQRFLQSSGGKINYYSFGLVLNRPITRHMTGSLSYQYYLKDSDVDIYDYTRNQLALNLIYAF